VYKPEGNIVKYRNQIYLGGRVVKKTIAQIDKHTFANKRVLMRVDFNVPQDDTGAITDDSRIRAALPSIQYLQGAGAKIVLMSHLGRPKGKIAKFTLKPVADRLRQLLTDDKSVGKILFAEDCIGEAAIKTVEQLQPGDVCVLENVRFYPEEEKNDPEFAKKLASLGDIYVNDAFGTAHRAHASTEGVTHYLRPALAGFLLEKEIKMLGETLDKPERPFATIIGGAKVSSKISVLDRLLTKANTIIIGGAMAFTFLKARGLNVGKSLVENDQVNYCLEMEIKAKELEVELILPSDVICAKEMKANATNWIATVDKITEDAIGLDIGPGTSNVIKAALEPCKTILWNGPMGVFEMAGFEKGTFALIDELVSLQKRGSKVIVGGGDSVAALGVKGIDEKQLTHISTGGGASLELLEGKPLPGIVCLDDVEKAATCST
jgi:phosphoglycerate kinase